MGRGVGGKGTRLSPCRWLLGDRPGQRAPSPRLPTRATHMPRLQAATGYHAVGDASKRGCQAPLGGTSRPHSDKWPQADIAEGSSLPCLFLLGKGTWVMRLAL